MFEVVHIFLRPTEKSASVNLESRRQCEQIMRRIYEEEPSYWPYGIDVASHDELFLIRKKGSMEPVGFVGWQRIKEDDGVTGYYSIGILPEYRQNGFAKAAVSQMLQTKAATVDRVKAFIVKGNNKSIGLAKTLGVPIRFD
jgi:RimJ/RimL family protein N-acetyltransferase